MNLSADIADDEQVFLDLEYSTSDVYTRFVYRSPEQALQVRRYLFDRGLCEFSPPYGRILRDGGRPVAMIATVPAGDMSRLRLRAALAMARSGILHEDPGLARRIRLADQTLMKFEPGDLYWSRMAVDESARGKGIAAFLTAQVEDEARLQRFRRIVLHVSPLSEVALRIHLRNGFGRLGAGHVIDSETGRSLEYLHLGKTVLHVPGNPRDPTGPVLHRRAIP